MRKGSLGLISKTSLVLPSGGVHGGHVDGGPREGPSNHSYSPSARERVGSDFQWRPSYRDIHNPGHSSTSSDGDCFHVNALLELGLYDLTKEMADWSVEDVWDDSQWQE